MPKAISHTFGVSPNEGGSAVEGTPTTTAADVPLQDRGAAQQPTAYRPGYELVAEQILELIAQSHLHPGDRMPTEN